MKAVVFAGAEIHDYAYYRPYLKDCTLIVCCDSGMIHAKNMGLTPSVIVGDFDSVDKETFDFFKAQNIPIAAFNSRKDETDLELGLDYAVEKGAEEILIFGGIGSRLDHTLANCHYLLYLLKKGIAARLINEKNEVVVIDKQWEIAGQAGDIVSTIPLSMKVKGITTQGLEYPLTDATLTIDDRLIAVSNVMTGNRAKITIKEGYLFVMRCRD